MSSIPFRVTHRRTSTSGRIPSLNTLLTGELYLQLADELIYFKNADENRLVTVITDASGNGLEKIKFSGASNLDIPYWSGSRFYATGISSFVQVNQTGSFVVSTQITNFVSKSETGNFITTAQTGSFGGGNVDLSAYALKSQTGNFITTSQTGAFGGAGVDLSSYVTTGQTGAYAAAALTGNFLTTSQTGVFASANSTGNFVTSAQTGVFALAANTGSFVTTAQTGVFALSADTGSFVTTAQTGVFALSADTGSFVTTAQTGVFALSADTGSFVTTAQTGVFALSTDTGSFVTTAQTGVFALSADTGSFVTTAQTGVFALAANTGSFVTTAQTGLFAPAAGTGKFASLDGSNYLCQTQIPNVTGDVCINAGSNNSTVYKIQGYSVSNQTPVIGQTLQFNGSSWGPGNVPAGGNGGGGLVYYFNDTIAADLPTGNLPVALSGTYELGRTGTLNQYSITTPYLSQAQYDPIVGFITDVLDPDVTAVPAGLFDFNIWASSNTISQTVLQLKVYKYDGATTTPTLLATSDDVYTYDGLVTAQYIMSIVLPQTTLTLTDRLFILLSAKALGNNKTVTLYFGGNTPSHVHTTFPSVGGSGLVKVINGVMQAPASLLFDADVSASAAIAGSKIEAGYFALASATGNFIKSSQTGAFAAAANTGAFVTSGQTGVFALAADTGAFVTSGQTGNFALASQLSGYVATGATGNFISSISGYTTGLISVINSDSTTTIGTLAANKQTNTIISTRGTSQAWGSYNVILASECSLLCGSYSAIIAQGYASSYNQIQVGSAYSVLMAGTYNTINSSNSAILGGCLNTTASAKSFIINSNNSNVCGSSSNASILSSYLSNICVSSNSSLLSSSSSSVISGSYSSVLNSAGSVSCAASYSAIIGGSLNQVRGCENVILSSKNSTISGSCLSLIIGGSGNCLSGNATGIVILGGYNITGNGLNTVYANNFCAYGGKYYGDASALTGLATGSFITTGMTGDFGGAGVDLTNYVTYSNLELLTRPEQRCGFVVGSDFVNSGSLTIALNAGFSCSEYSSSNNFIASTNFSLISSGATNNGIVGGLYNEIRDNISNSVILGGQYITGTSNNTAYAINYCSYKGKYYGDGSALTGLATGSFITTAQTGAFGGAGVDLSTYITTGQTGAYAAAAGTGSFVTTAQTGNFITTSQTGGFVDAANTGNFITLSKCQIIAKNNTPFDICAITRVASSYIGSDRIVAEQGTGIFYLCDHNDNSADDCNLYTILNNGYCVAQFSAMIVGHAVYGGSNAFTTSIKIDGIANSYGVLTQNKMIQHQAFETDDACVIVENQALKIYITGAQTGMRWGARLDIVGMEGYD